MIKKLFSVNTWTKENNLYYIEYDYNIISAVYKLNQTNYELVTNIDIKDLGNKVRIYSIDRFVGFVLLVNSAEEQSVTWGNINGNIRNQTDLQNALNFKANVSDIPTTTSDLTNDSDFITSSTLNGYATQTWVGQQGYITGITSSDVTSALGYTPYDSENPDGYITSSALASYATTSYVDSGLSGKQATLVSGTNIKTVNNQSLLGSGNIDIQGGGSITVDSALSTTSTNPVQNKVITTALSGKANSADLATVATSGSYTDLNNKPTIPTVNNATLTIQKNGTNVATFTANASSNVTANISVPNTVSSVSSSSTNEDAVGAKLFYDTCGDIETLINAL